MTDERFVPSKYAGHTYDKKTDKHYYVSKERVGCEELFDEIENLETEILNLKRHLKFIVDCMSTETVFDILDKMFESEEYFNKE